MRNLMLVLSYDGTNYCGWQIQPNGLSIQQALTDAMEKVTGVATRPVASGRTDSGVHALGQVAQIQTASELAPAALAKALNANLPDDIAIHSIREVHADFDAVRDATGKHYRYVFHDGRVGDVFLRRYAWHVRRPLDEAAMDRAARAIEGTRDFRCFETHWPNRVSSVRTVRRCQARRFGELVYLDVEANGFLYNMARAIAGTLYEIGRGKWPEEKVRAILETNQRAEAGPTAPAHGLFLVRVDYEWRENGEPRAPHSCLPDRKDP